MSVILIIGGNERVVSAAGSAAGAAVVTVGATETDLTTFDLIGALTPQRLPDVVVIGPHVDFERAMFLASSMDLAYPAVPVVLQHDLDADALVVALRSAVRDVMPVAADAETIHDVLRRALQVRQRAASPVVPPAPVVDNSKVITVISPKGGVGKTSVSSSLALGLAQQAPMQVVLVDLDLQFGDIASLLDLAPVHTLADVFSGRAGDSLILKTLLTVHPAGMYVLCGADSPATNEGVTGDQVRRLLEDLSQQFPYVVVDTAAGLLEPTIAALEVSTDAVVLSTMDVSCIRNVRKEVDVLAELGVLPAIRHMVLNFADKNSGMKVRDVEGVVGLPVNVVIPQAPEVRLAANHGEPLMLKRRGGGPYVKAIHSLIKRIEGHQRELKNPHKGVKVA
jgi:pilus assembly protein CpaE